MLRDKVIVVCITKSLPIRIIVPAPEIIQPRLLIVHVGSITERLDGTESGSKGAGGGKDLSPCIVYIFYHFCAIAVNKANDIALQIYNVTIFSSIKLHNGRAILGIVPEVQGVAALGHVDDVLAMQGVVSDGAAHSLADAQAIGVIGESGRGAGFGHLFQLAALFPGVGPGAVGERIADGIVGDGGAVVLDQLILPGGAAMNKEGVLRC